MTPGMASPRILAYNTITVPAIVDVPTGAVVTNDFAQITIDFELEWTALHRSQAPDLYPDHLRAEMDELMEDIYRDVNNGVYKAGFATSQAAYEEAVIPLFDTLDWLEHRLARGRYLFGDRLTEADWRLFTTLVRFDPVYVGHFKCNLRRIADYPNLMAYTRDLYQHEGVAETVDMHHIKHHYYASHDMINPTGVVPAGPILDLLAPHGRGAS